MVKKGKQRSESQIIHLAIWMIGLGILFLFDIVWPGILILIGVSMLLESVSKGKQFGETAAELTESVKNVITAAKPEAKDVIGDAKTETPAAKPENTPSAIATSAFPYRTDLLPKACPWCGAPVYTSEVKWQAHNIARCSFCNANLIDEAPKRFNKKG